MPEHYTSNTTAVLRYCSTCNKNHAPGLQQAHRLLPGEPRKDSAGKTATATRTATGIVLAFLRCSVAPLLRVSK